MVSPRSVPRIAAQRLRVKRVGYEDKGGLLMYEWELQKRGVWHLHFRAPVGRDAWFSPASETSTGRVGPQNHVPSVGEACSDPHLT
jgi:hypothetical protein